MKKAIYESPNLIVMQFETDDVIRTSGENGYIYKPDIFGEVWN